MKKETKKIKEYIKKVVNLAMEINIKTEMACWINISGHVDNMEITIAKSKKDYNEKIYKAHLDYDDFEENDFREVIVSIKEVIAGVYNGSGKNKKLVEREKYFENLKNTLERIGF